MHRILLIFNPNADRGRSSRRSTRLRAKVHELGGADWRGTEGPGHAARLAADAAREGYATIIALGGDGTVHEIINGLMQLEPARRPRLGIVPIGSGNDFAYAAGLPTAPLAALERAFTGSERLVDVAQLRDGSGRCEYFNNSAGIGFDAAINIRTRQLKYLHGFVMYLTATLQSIAQNFQAPHMQVSYDGGRLDQPIMMLTVGNGPREGGGFMTTPAAKIDDGVLDFVYINQISQLRMLQLLPKVMAATHVKEPDVHLSTFTRLVIEADRALPIHLDGELFAPYEANVRRVEIEVVPGAIRLVA